MAYARDWLRERLAAARMAWMQGFVVTDDGLEGDVYGLTLKEAGYADTLAEIDCGMRGEETRYTARGYWNENGGYMVLIATRRWDEAGNEVDDIQMLEGATQDLQMLALRIDDAATN